MKIRLFVSLLQEDLDWQPASNIAFPMLIETRNICFASGLACACRVAMFSVLAAEDVYSVNASLAQW
jgi:hypothetical protein